MKINRKHGMENNLLTNNYNPHHSAWEIIQGLSYQQARKKLKKVFGLTKSEQSAIIKLAKSNNAFNYGCKKHYLDS